MSQEEIPTIHRGHAGDPFAFGEKKCILCGRCLEVCPLFQATEREEFSPRAKFHLAQFVSEHPGELDRIAASKLAELCLCCGRCEKACPQGLCAPHLVADLRAAHPDMTSWLWRQWIERGKVLWPAAMALSGLAPKALKPERLEPALEKLKALKAGGVKQPWLAVAEWDKSADGEAVVLFPGCVADNVRNSWTRKSSAILKSLGYDLKRAPKWECCAATLGHAGLKDTRAAMQEANIRAWRKAGRPKIATFCATCAYGLRSYAGISSLGRESGEEKLWLDALIPLAALWGDTKFEIDGDKAPERLFYHTPCHGAEGGDDLKWLRRAAGERLARASTDKCCGMGGVMQLTDAGLTERVAAGCWEFFGAAPGDQLVTSCSGCVTQLAAAAPQGVRVGHWLELVEI